MLDVLAAQWRRGAARLVLLACLPMLAACSPDYNWRELTVADGHARAAFPARAQTDTRRVMLAGEPLEFSVAASTVNDAMFAVNYAPWPAGWAADDARRAVVAQAVARSAYINLQVQHDAPLPVDGAAMSVRGAGERAGTWSMSRVWATPHGVVQALALGSEVSLPAERAREFMDQVVIAP